LSSIDNGKLLSSFISQYAKPDIFEDIINISLFQSDFTTNVTSSSNDITSLIKTFISEVRKDVNKYNIQTYIPIQNLVSLMDITKQILEIRDDIGSRIITYENVKQHFTKRSLFIEKELDKVINTRLPNIEEFHKTVDKIILICQSYYEIVNMKNTLTKFDVFLDTLNNDNINLFNKLIDYKDVIIESYNSLSTLQTINKAEHLSDYIVLSDNLAFNNISDKLVTFLSNGYNYFKSGYPLIDDNVGGIESSSVHIVSGPSNHGKSLMLVNLCRNIIKNNVFADKNDAILYITLEDDIYKLIRRFISIFGNNDAETLRKIFVSASERLKISPTLKTNIQEIYNQLLQDSLKDIVDNKCTLILKHSNENTFSPADISRFIDRLSIEGYNTKIVIVDYIDVMVPSNNRYSNFDDYNSQGQIVLELRGLSRSYSVPVITATQNTRASENTSYSLSNEQLGDSIKKLRYADYLYMIRMNRDINVDSDTVKKDTQGDTEDIDIFNMDSDLFNLIPFEFKITKAKEGKKNIHQYHLFNEKNLRICPTINSCKQDLNDMKKTQKKLDKYLILIDNNIEVDTVFNI
jgi:replicative DNA helicase